MTLAQFFEVCSQNASVVLFYFIATPLTALLGSIFGKGEGHLSPWKYLYSFLIYAVTIPGLFAISLSIYLFFFERGSIMDANIFTQVLPIISMLLTISIIRKTVDLDLVPGFNKLSSLMLVISIVLLLLWIMEKTNIFVFTYMPFWQFILLLVAVFVLLRFLLKKAL